MKLENSSQHFMIDGQQLIMYLTRDAYFEVFVAASESCVFCRGRGGMRKRIKMQVRVLERKVEKKE